MTRNVELKRGETVLGALEQMIQEYPDAVRILANRDACECMDVEAILSPDAQIKAVEKIERAGRSFRGVPIICVDHLPP